MSDVLLTGAFGVAVALITWVLAGLRDRQRLRSVVQREHIGKLENVYAGCIEAFELSIGETLSLGSYEEVKRLHAKNSAMLRLLSTRDINDQSEKVSGLMHQWSALYRRASPKQVAGTDMAITASGDSENMKKAQEVQRRLNEELVALIDLMGKHLARERKRA